MENGIGGSCSIFQYFLRNLIREMNSCSRWSGSGWSISSSKSSIQSNPAGKSIFSVCVKQCSGSVGTTLFPTYHFRLIKNWPIRIDQRVFWNFWNFEIFLTTFIIKVLGLFTTHTVIIIIQLPITRFLACQKSSSFHRLPTIIVMSLNLLSHIRKDDLSRNYMGDYLSFFHILSHS